MLENIRLVREQICDTADLEAESQRLMEEMNMLSDRVQKCISENLTKFDAGKVSCQFSCIPFLFYGKIDVM